MAVASKNILIQLNIKYHAFYGELVVQGVIWLFPHVHLICAIEDWYFVQQTLYDNTIDQRLLEDFDIAFLFFEIDQIYLVANYYLLYSCAAQVYSHNKFIDNSLLNPVYFLAEWQPRRNYNWPTTRYT